MTGPAAAGEDPVAQGDASLLALIDRLTAILERSDLSELEVEAGGTAIVLRKPSAFPQPETVSPVQTAVAVLPVPGGPLSVGGPVAVGPGVAAAAPAKPSVKAPLTGIFYTAPSPGATPYVSVGDQVATGQVIGLIEAMKLFNEIKSDLSGLVARVCVETGSLVKTRQPLIEVDPL